MSRYANPAAPRALLASALVVASLWFAAALAQSNARQYDFDIGAVPVTQALLLFSAQTELQHAYFPVDEEEEKRVVHPVKGRYTADEALALLLPEGFTFSWVNPRTVSIVSPPLNPPPGGVRNAAASKDQQHSELSKDQQSAMENGGGRSGSAREPYAFDWRVIVEGNRIFDSVFDSLDIDMPATVFDRDDIDASGASTLTDVFRYVTQQPNIKPESYLGDGTQFADLRGLGFDTTLVLINGRRTVASASALAVNAFDLNSIPLGAVERIEIVSDSMSAIHGADAIGGIVNIVLRDNIPEPRLDIDYGGAAGGAVERHAAFGASGTLGRARGSIVLDYFDRSPLLGRERDRWNNQDFTRFGGLDWRSPTAAPGNVRSATSENLPGLPSSLAAIPAATSGGALTPSDFLATAGQQNRESLFQYQSILDAGTRKSAVAHGEYEFRKQLTAYGDLLYVDGETLAQFEPPALSSARVSGVNPHNPFGEDVLVDTLLTDLEPRTFTRRAQMIRAAGGVRGSAGSWDWELSLQRNQNDAITLRTRELDPVRVATALAATDPADALDPFGSNGANDQSLLRSLLRTPLGSNFRTEGTQSVAFAKGPLMTLPAGPLALAAGVEWRDEFVRYYMAPVDMSGAHQRSIFAAFAELRLPLLSEAANVPAMNDLALVLSGRFDNYSDVGNSVNPECALIWRPTARLMLRTSVAQSFRPPPLFDLYAPSVDVRVPTADPARNGEFALPVWRAGGNPDLKPASANSLNVGLQLEPKGAPGLRLAANYWRILIDDTIAIPSAARLLAAESLFPERVFRGPPSVSDAAAGMPGPLQLIDVRRLNFGSLRTSGIDASASVTLDTRVGKLKPELSATWIENFTTSDLVEGADFNRVGVADLQGTIARWRAVASISWNRGGLGVTGAVRYVPSYDDVDFLGGRNGRKVAAQAIVDTQLSLNLADALDERSPWVGFQIRAGVFNLLDDEPPFAQALGFTGYDATQSDLRQRFAYLKITKEF